MEKQEKGKVPNEKGKEKEIEKQKEKTKWQKK